MKLHKTKENEIYYYYLKDNEKRFMYRHKYEDNLGKRKEKKKSGFKTEKEALRSLLEVKASILDKGHIDNSNITVGQWLDTWYETYNSSWEISSVYQRKQIIEQYLKPHIGHYKLNKLDKATYTRVYINEVLKTLKSSTVQLHHRIFNIAINAAVDNEIIRRNRFTRIPFEMDEKLDNFLTSEELATFINASKRYLNITRYTMVLLLAYTGLRHGEMLGLKWGNIDFDNHTITIDSTRDHYGDRKPKTLNSYRTIPVDEFLLKQLEKYQKWCMAAKLHYGEALDKEKDYIFITEENEACNQEELRTTFRIVYKRIEKEGITLKRITPPSMRHTHATILVNGGIPPKTVADRLGNSVDMVYKVYSHSYKEMESKAVNVFSESIKSGANYGANL